ncbi:Sentrin-specific protease 2 [Paramuricea clavata]|uniref:Sentrin-specific protease 2 n=1 Tax=Paramuricea clavata TaxID=317549 RepID=A0A6S7LQZ8_PARCT|nr:Sentrin-specific protease 2 [Paramuricea clavata]
MGRCTACPSWIEEIAKGCDVLEKEVTWYEWERIYISDLKCKSGKVNVVKRMKKVCKEGTVKDVLTSLQTKLPSFLEHVFVKRHQAAYFEEKLNSIEDDEAVIQVDFAENYTWKFQDEIQSAHWNQQQVSLFTVAVWTKGPKGDKVCVSHVIVSDELNHDKKSVAVFMSTVMDKFVKEMHADVRRAYVFSDGPSSQFKNRYIVNFLHHLNSKVSIQWNFFATSHGKGAVDGIGGTVKRMEWNAVNSRKASEVVDAKTFYDAASKLTTSISVSFVSQKEMNDMYDLLCLQKYFNDAPPIPGISRFHCIEPKDSYNSIAPEVFPFDTADESECDDCTDVEGSGPGDSSDNKSVDREYVHGGAGVSDGTNDDANVNIHEGVPDEMIGPFKQSAVFNLPHYMTIQVDSVMSGLISFCGGSLIDESDLQGLIGNSKSPEINWLSNFIIDDYLKLVKSACIERGDNVQTITWEIFEKASINQVAKAMKKDCDFPLMSQDLLLIPCNPEQSKHWFLLAVLPNKKLIIVLDSLAGSFIKPTVEKLLQKVGLVLAVVDPNIQIQDWRFMCNTPEDIPQQDNIYDCGIYTCMYARCLAGLGVLVDQEYVLKFRQHILLSLHRNDLMEVPENEIKMEKYYAVDYVNKYYIGRALSMPADNTVKFKFSHSVGAKQFNWPKRDDFDDVHISCIFYGPVTLEMCGPFVVPKQSEIEKIFAATR